MPTNAGPDPDESYGTSAGPAGVNVSPDERPELIVGAAFAGGLLLATILKRFGR
jgi:hypothetical protein